jgi:hypothetical protein
LGRIYIGEWAVNDRNFSFESASVILSGPALGCVPGPLDGYPSTNVSEDFLRDE